MSFFLFFPHSLIYYTTMTFFCNFTLFWLFYFKKWKINLKKCKNCVWIIYFRIPFPPLFFCVGLQIELMCFFAFPLSLPLPWVLPMWALECTYLSSVARQRGRKTFFFLFLYSFFKEKSLGLKVPIWRHSKYSLSLRFCIPSLEFSLPRWTGLAQRE